MRTTRSSRTQTGRSPNLLQAPFEFVRWSILLLVVVSATVSPVEASGGGELAPYLRYSGGLRDEKGNPLVAPATLDFIFKKPGGSTCLAMGVPITPNADGDFVVDIPISNCNGFFDGSDVLTDIQYNGAVVVSGTPLVALPQVKYAESAGSPRCPPQYSYAGTALGTNTVLCQRGSDELVKIGEGLAAFWMDRYEATVWSEPFAAGVRYASATEYATAGFPSNGQWTQFPLYAASVKGSKPATGMTWFQASEACRASGKRLPTNEEWQVSARGTPDPGANDGLQNSKCNTASAALRETGLGTACASAWGVEDMIGNAGEVLLDWKSSPRAPASAAPSDTWPFAGDWTLGVRSVAYSPAAPSSGELPAAVSRGGTHTGIAGQGYGLFAYNLRDAPSAAAAVIGFRCVVTR